MVDLPVEILAKLNALSGGSGDVDENLEVPKELQEVATSVSKGDLDRGAAIYEELRIWSGVEPVGANLLYEDLGVDQIALWAVVAQLERNLGCEVNDSEVREAKTVSDLVSLFG